LLAFNCPVGATSTDDDSVRAIGLGIVGKSLLVLPPGLFSYYPVMLATASFYNDACVAARPYITLTFCSSQKGGVVHAAMSLVWACYRQCYRWYLVDSASSHMLVSKIKPCMSKYKAILYGETANGSLNQLSFI